MGLTEETKEHFKIWSLTDEEIYEELGRISIKAFASYPEDVRERAMLAEALRRLMKRLILLGEREKIESELTERVSEMLIEISRKLSKRGFALSAKHFETSSKLLKDYELDEVVNRREIFQQVSRGED